jgi:hypothetical protein
MLDVRAAIAKTKNHTRDDVTNIWIEGRNKQEGYNLP